MNEMFSADDFRNLFAGHPLAMLGTFTDRELAAAIKDHPALPDGAEVLGNLSPLEVQILTLMNDLADHANGLASTLQEGQRQPEELNAMSEAWYPIKADYDLISKMFWASVRTRLNANNIKEIQLCQGGEIIAKPEQEPHVHFSLVLGTNSPFGGLPDRIIGTVMGTCTFCPLFGTFCNGLSCG